MTGLLQTVPDMGNIVFRLDPDAPERALRPAGPQGLEMERPSAAVRRGSDAERHRPVGACRWHRDEGGPDFAGPEQFRTFRGTGGTEVQDGVLVASGRVEHRQVPDRAGLGHRETERPELRLLGVVLQRLRQLHEPLRRRKHVAPERGERRPPRRAVEQPLPEMLLQRGDPPARHGLRHADSLSAEREATALAHLYEHSARRHQIHNGTVCQNSMRSHVCVFDRMNRCRKGCRT